MLAARRGPAGARLNPFRVRDETCPVSTRGGTRLVQLVREGKGGGARLNRAGERAGAAQELRAHEAALGLARAEHELKGHQIEPVADLPGGRDVSG